MCLIQTDLSKLVQSGKLILASHSSSLNIQYLNSPETATDGLRWVAILFAILVSGVKDCDQLDCVSCVCLLHRLRVSLLK